MRQATVSIPLSERERFVLLGAVDAFIKSGLADNEQITTAAFIEGSIMAAPSQPEFEDDLCELILAALQFLLAQVDPADPRFENRKILIDALIAKISSALACLKTERDEA